MTRRLAIFVAVFLIMGACGGDDGVTTTTGAEPTRDAVPSTTSAAEPTSTSTLAPTTTSTLAPTTTTTTTTVVALVLGDFGDGSRKEHEVASAMRAVAQNEEVAAIITTGDNLYVTDAAVWTEPYGWVEELTIPVWISWGNHDLQSGSRRRLVQDLFAPPARWYTKTLGGSTLVVFLDANQPTNTDQLQWLNETLAVHRGALIAVFHQPAVSCSLHGSTHRVQEMWVPLFDRFGVDLVLNGHDHNYQHFEVGGTDYVVSGGGGRNLYRMSSCPQGTDPPLAFADQEQHFLQLVISDEFIRVRAIAATGDVLDEFVVSLATAQADLDRAR